MFLYQHVFEQTQLMYTKHSASLRAHLNQNSPAQLSFDQRLGHPAGGIGSGTVHLGEVFAREGSATVSSPPSVRVDNDLPARHTSIALLVEQFGD